MKGEIKKEIERCAKILQSIGLQIQNKSWAFCNFLQIKMETSAIYFVWNQRLDKEEKKLKVTEKNWDKWFWECVNDSMID